MAYRALYRVWRPQTFRDMVGQEHITKTLQNAIKEQRFSHAYLFCGPRGTGKTSAAKIMAKAVNCTHGSAGEPCNACEACQSITDGSAVDVMEIDAASNRGIDEIRDLRDKVKYAPTQVRFKIYIIDEVHMLTTEAFNALLKTLEEPPSHVLFILATTEPHKLPATIISRCQRFDFRRIGSATMVERMKEIVAAENINISDQALYFIARSAEGGMRDALSLLDQALSFGGDSVELSDILAITGAVSGESIAEGALMIKEQDAAGAIKLINQLIQGGKSPEQYLEDLLLYFRDLLLYKTAPSLEEIQGHLEMDPEFKNLGETFSNDQLFAIIEQLNRFKNEMKWAGHPRILLEMALIQLCQPTTQHDVEPAMQNPIQTREIPEIGQLMQRIQALEKKLSQLQSSTVEGGEKSGKSQSASRKESRRGIQPTVKIPVARVRDVTTHVIPMQTKKLISIWSDVLSRVRDKNVQVHAWLMDGSPVALSEDGLVIAFKNAIHCETTARDLNKGVIGEVVASVIHRHVEIIPIMENQWKEMISTLQSQESQHPDSPDGEEKEAPEDHVKVAYRLFGEDLIEIKE